MLYDTHTDMSLLFPILPSQGERPEQKSEEGSDQINASKSDISPQKKKKTMHILTYTH